MKTLGWPPNFVARCPVRLFEAVGGGGSWQSTGTVGEFHMKPLGNAVLHFQLRDLLDNQILFEHTMRKADAFMVAANRFFVIRLENGSFRGFGFTDGAAATEMKERVQKAVKPFTIQETIGESIPRASPSNEAQASMSSDVPKRASSFLSKKTSEIVSYESVPRRSSSRRSTLQHSKEQRPVPSIATFSSTSESRFNWRFVMKGLATLSHLKKLGAMSHLFGWREHELEIGYPTDVKHVAHIGWDGPSVSGPSWMDEIKPAPDFSSGPLREFGQPRGPDWIHDAVSAAKWGAQGLAESISLPPAPPKEFQDSESGQRSRKPDHTSKNKSKTGSSRSRVYRT